MFVATGVPAIALAQDRCTPLPGASVATLTGTVTQASRRPPAGLEVVAHWRSWDYVESRLIERDRETSGAVDASGSYALCVPRGVQLRVEVRAGARGSPAVMLPAAEAVSRRLDLALNDDPATAPLELAGGGLSAMSVSGTIVDAAGAPVPGARVTISGSNAFAITGDAGRFELAGQAVGEHMLFVRRLGFRADSRPVVVSAASAGELRWVLTAVPVHLAEVVALGSPSEFEMTSGFGERRRRGPGVFFDRSDIERRKPHILTDLLRSVAGFRVERSLTRWGYQTTATMDRASSGSVGCPIDYYVNGHEYTPTSMGIDSDVPAAQIEAIEVYKPSQTPPQFLGMHSRCGAVVIWTRYRAHELDG